MICRVSIVDAEEDDLRECLSGRLRVLVDEPDASRVTRISVEYDRVDHASRPHHETPCLVRDRDLLGDSSRIVSRHAGADDRPPWPSIRERRSELRLAGRRCDRPQRLGIRNALKPVTLAIDAEESLDTIVIGLEVGVCRSASRHRSHLETPP